MHLEKFHSKIINKYIIDVKLENLFDQIIKRKIKYDEDFSEISKTLLSMKEENFGIRFLKFF